MSLPSAGASPSAAAGAAAVASSAAGAAGVKRLALVRGHKLQGRAEDLDMVSYSQELQEGRNVRHGEQLK